MGTYVNRWLPLEPLIVRARRSFSRRRHPKSSSLPVKVRYGLRNTDDTEAQRNRDNAEILCVSVSLCLCGVFSLYLCGGFLRVSRPVEELLHRAATPDT